MCTDSFIFGSMTCCMSIFLSVSVLGGLVSFFVGSVTNTSPFFLSFQHCRSSHCSLIYTSWYVGMFFIPIFAFSLLTCMQSTCSVPQFDSEKKQVFTFIAIKQIRDLKVAKEEQDIGFYAGFVGEQRLLSSTIVLLSHLTIVLLSVLFTFSVASCN
jgi:hypothetical protein